MTSVDLMMATASSPRRCQALIADAQADLPEQAVGPHLLHEAAQPIAAAQRDNQAGSGGRSGARGIGRCLARDEPVHFRVRDAVMAAGGVRRADPSLVDPLLQRRVADSEPAGGRADGEERHAIQPFRWDPGINLNRITMKRFETNAS